jgi:DNA-binding HxlR family transcriptional regulator
MGEGWQKYFCYYPLRLLAADCAVHTKKEAMAARKPTSTNSRNRVALDEFCGMTYALNLLGGRWKLLIIYKLGKRTQRFSELKKTIPHITDRMLTLQLRELERDGLVVRTVFAEVPPRVEYALTASARALSPSLHSLEAWGDEHQQATKSTPAQIEGPVSE